MTPAEQIKILEQSPGNGTFYAKIEKPLIAQRVHILQLNVGKKCNLSCKHCHVEAGPDRKELMSREILEKCLEVVAEYPIETIDITGGSPEMNPELPWFMEQVAALDRRLMVRSNLVILLESEYKHFMDLYVKYHVEVVASLPAYSKELVDRQRGPGAYGRVIQAMRMLNEKGYGQPDSGLALHLVHNPVGAYLPGSQKALESEYRHRLYRDHGVVFNHLFSLTNCPIGRYLEFLIRSENYDDYMRTLINAFNLNAVKNVMCRTTVSVGWNGTLYDCDFNQMLEMPVNHGALDHVSKFDMEQLMGRQIMIGNHCFSCTAGAGSSCQGALE